MKAAFEDRSQQRDELLTDIKVDHVKISNYFIIFHFFVELHLLSHSEVY